LKKPKISVLGIGYVGLCTAVGFASKGYNVTASTGHHMATTRYRVLLLIRDGKVIRSKETTQ